MSYPVTVTVTPSIGSRNRLTTAFRLILAIPHLILVGGIGFSVTRGGRDGVGWGSETGLLGAVVGFLAVISWFTIVIAGSHIIGIRQLTGFYLRWRTRALSYLMLLEDAYPPFGDAPYPAAIEIVDPTGPRNRMSVGIRLLLGIPHFVLLALLVFAWWLATIVAWILILVSGQYPAGLYDFSVGVLRWLMRVEAYVFLMVDEYPPFSLT